ncbi:MAG: ATP-binding protein [Gemmatimonadaceae bacterium]
MSTQTTPVILSWSGGKDSALALHALMQDPLVDVVGLLTTVTAEYDRVSIHGVRRTLLQAQARLLGLPLYEATLKAASTSDEYEASFLNSLQAIRSARPDIAQIAFGDLFLEDVRAYREALLSRTEWTPLFPIWGRHTGDLARSFIDDGFVARLVCVDTTQLDGGFSGREFDTQLLADLPASVDPCGERGEFHTFVSDGPPFASAVPYVCGERVMRDDRFMYCDLVDAPSETHR